MRIFFFSEWSRWPWSPLFGRVFFPDFISCITYFIVKKKKKQKKMLMWIKRSFVWLKKIVLDDSFYEIVFFLARGCFLFLRRVGQMSCLIWGFFHFFNDSTRLDEIQSQFFPRCCERGSWLCAGKMRIYIHFLGFFISKTWQKNEIKNFFFNRYHIIIFGNLYVQFYVPSGTKNFQKKIIKVKNVKYDKKNNCF